MLKCLYGSSAGRTSEVTHSNFTVYYKKRNGQMREDVLLELCQLRLNVYNVLSTLGEEDRHALLPRYPMIRCLCNIAMIGKSIGRVALNGTIQSLNSRHHVI